MAFFFFLFFSPQPLARAPSSSRRAGDVIYLSFPLLYQRVDSQSNKQIVGKLGAMQRFVGMRSCLASSQLI